MSRSSKTPSGSAPVAAPVRLKGVNRALQVLDYLAENPGRATDIAEELEISWATLHRTLQQLEQGGFLQKDAQTNRYSVGPRMWFIGSTYVANHPVLEAARSYLKAAVRNSRVTVQLVERSDRQSTVLYNADAEEEVTKAAVGYHFPLHVGSKGQVLLAHADEEFIEDYLASPMVSLTNNSITDPDMLREIMAQIRQQGYAVTIADVQLFTASMSAPVRDRSDRVVAAVCFVTRKSAMQRQETREMLLELLMETAQNVSVALGWRPNRPNWRAES